MTSSTEVLRTALSATSEIIGVYPVIKKWHLRSFNRRKKHKVSSGDPSASYLHSNCPTGAHCAGCKATTHNTHNDKNVKHITHIVCTLAWG